MREIWSFSSANELVFGWGSVSCLGAHLSRRGFRKAMVVTDANLVRAGVVRQVVDSVAQAGCRCEVFEGGEAEPSLAVAEKAVERAGQIGPDVIIGVGGGSNMDLAKMTSLLHTHGGSPSSYFGFDNVPGPVTPIVGVPTTAGTGSEVSHAAVLTDQQNDIKVSTLSPHLRPVLGLVDPELTIGCPKNVTADSGIDALTHAIEAYCARDYSELQTPGSEPVAYSGKMPVADAFAERAVALIGEHLVNAVHDPTNRSAREGMALASTLAGLAFSNAAVSVVHGLEYPMGAALHCSHGAGNGLLLPYVMRFNLPARLDQFATIARLLGKRGDPDADAETRASWAIDAVVELKERIGIPQRIRDIGGTREQLPSFAEKAFSIKRLMELNPREMTQNDLLQVLEDAY